MEGLGQYYKRMQRLVVTEASLAGMGLFATSVGVDAASLGFHRAGETLIACGIPSAAFGAICLRQTFRRLNNGLVGPEGPDDPSREAIEPEFILIKLPARPADNESQQAA